MREIYFVCNGTSTHDIIISIGKNTILNDYSKLENIGFKELLICQDLNNELLSGDISVYTSLSYKIVTVKY